MWIAQAQAVYPKKYLNKIVIYVPIERSICDNMCTPNAP